ncbi:hypothetical protein [Apibacter sp. HY039]|uniref:hypothetical protein n=1 Tax=Apibacter sp. HY039 TaxID=2501476 RepID=UPI000FEBAC25|nr:hypothetical protein [Apibacter sp. HY039]
MIKKFSHKTIDKKVYGLALESTKNYMVYAELWFLDIVSPDGYDIWILNDFEAIMPVPYQKKVGCKFVIQPPFCQQLGIFYKKSISINDFSALFSKLNQYKVRNYHFNEDNTQYFKNEMPVLFRTNQTLYLNKDYSELYKKFNSNRKREINKLQRLADFKVTESFSIDAIFKIVNDNEDIFPHRNRLLLRKLLETADHRKKLYSFFIIPDYKDSPITCLILIKSCNRVISLLPLRAKSTFKGTISYLYDKLFKQFSNSPILFDFEGSEISGIYNFNKSFGAENITYASFTNFKWFEILKKIRNSNH